MSAISRGDIAFEKLANKKSLHKKFIHSFCTIKKWDSSEYKIGILQISKSACKKECPEIQLLLFLIIFVHHEAEKSSANFLSVGVYHWL